MDHWRHLVVTTCLDQDHWWGFSTQNAHMIHIVNLIRLQNGVNVLIEVSIWISTTWWVSLLLGQWVPEGTCSQVLRSTSVDSKRLESIKFSVFKIDWNCNFVGLLHHPIWLWFFGTFGNYFSTFSTTFLAQEYWWGFSTRNAHIIHIVNCKHNYMYLFSVPMSYQSSMTGFSGQ